MAADGGVHVELTPADSAAHHNVTMIAPGPPRAAVQGGGRAGAELAARAFGIGQRTRGFGDQHVRRRRRISARRTGRRVAAPAVILALDGDLDVHRRRWNSATARPPSTAPAPGRGGAGRASRSTTRPRRRAILVVRRCQRPGELVVQIREHRPRRRCWRGLRRCSNATASTSRGRRSPRSVRRWSTCSASSPSATAIRPAVSADGSRCCARTELERDLHAVLPAPAPPSRCSRPAGSAGRWRLGGPPARGDAGDVGLTACLNPCPTG